MKYKGIEVGIPTLDMIQEFNQKLQHLVDWMKPYYYEVIESLKNEDPEKWSELYRESVKLGLHPSND